MNISRALAIQILKYLDKHPDFYFPFFVMCQEYSPEDDYLREKTKCDKFVLDEFIDGKATAFSDCFRLIKNFQICSREAKDNLRHFIFLTAEGLTKTPEDMDIDNLQVLATLDGKNKKDAFRKFAVEYGHLLNAKFDDVIVMELADKKEYYFSLKDGIYRGT